MLLGAPCLLLSRVQIGIKNRASSFLLQTEIIHSLAGRRLKVGLATVPHLYRVCLDIQSDDEKAKVRASLQNSEGLWQYPASDWI